EVKEDYLNSNSQLCATLDKFSMYPIIHVKSGVSIRVQPESIKRYKPEKKRKQTKKNYNLSESVSDNHLN
ncbi:6829_t:CDS:2, partial [Racocetra persica]